MKFRQILFRITGFFWKKKLIGERKTYREVQKMKSAQLKSSQTIKNGNKTKKEARLSLLKITS